MASASDLTPYFIRRRYASSYCSLSFNACLDLSSADCAVITDLFVATYRSNCSMRNKAACSTALSCVCALDDCFIMAAMVAIARA